VTIFVSDVKSGPFNLLQNGDLTGGFYYLTEWGHEMHEVQLPVGWDLFQYRPISEDPQTHRPECKIENGDHEPSLTSPVWKAFTTFSKHHYTLGQRVQVAVGTELKLSAWVYAWSSRFDQWGISVDGSYRTRIGIDPFGGINPDADEVVWNHTAPGLKSMDCLQEHTLQATAKAGMITVWLQGDAEWALKHNDAFWDGAHLVALSTPPGPGDPALEARVAALERQLAGYGTVEAFGKRFVIETQ